MEEYIKDKITNGDRLATIVKQIPEGNGRDSVVAMCSGVVEGFLLATDYQKAKEEKHGV
jgi:hypothetical protein